jgi:iron complex transport system substrate-binding protein
MTERKQRPALAAILSFVALAAIGVQSARADAPVQPVNDQRILSIGGDITEILYALGVKDRIVAIDTTSQYPPDALKEKKNVGYMRALSPEGVLAAGPTLVIASDQAGPPEVIKALKESAVTYVEIKSDYTLQGIVSKVREIARVTGTESNAEKIAESIESEIRLLNAATEKPVKTQKALFVLSVQNGRALVAGQHTAADAVLQLAGAENAATGLEGFKPLTDEALVELAPDVIVTMRGHQPGGTEQVKELAGVKATPAGQAKRFIEMDGLSLLAFGPRTPTAARELHKKIYGGETRQGRLVP